MKEHPILFQTEMVQAILEGRKTQTRRLITERNSRSTSPLKELDFTDAFVDGRKSKYHYLKVGRKQDSTRHRVFCKYEPPGEMEGNDEGDILWVRESCANLNSDFESMAPYYVYKADIDHPDQHGPVTWKPSIHMPKAACRLRLKITEIRIERLHDISEEDAKAEGMTVPAYKNGETGSYKSAFAMLWEIINGEESWNLNPWVWVISFEKQITNERKSRNVSGNEVRKG